MHQSRIENLKRLPLVSYVALAQGLFYMITGIWPFISERTFEKVTGPKTDFWLVKTVGLLISVIGGVLGIASLRRKQPVEVPALAVGSALSLAAVDVAFVAKDRISPVYLLDALAEGFLMSAWIFALRNGKQHIDRRDIKEDHARRI